MKHLIFAAAFSAALIAPCAHAQTAESPRATQLRTEIQRTETEIAKSVNIEATLTEAIKGASAAASSVANLDWGVVFDDDYKQTLATRWVEEQEQKALEARRRTGAILTEKRNAFEADKSEANLAAMLEAELASTKSRLNFLQARRLWYEEQTTSFARDFAALAATSAEAIAGDVSEAFWDNFKGKMQQAFADIRAGNIANLPGYLAGMAKDILSGISADLIKASMKEYLIADFLQRNAVTPRYVAAYWYANFVLPDLAEKNKIDAMVDKVSAAYMDKASEHLLNEAAKRRAVDALAPKIKNQLMKDPTYVRDLAGRVRTGGATAAAAWGKQYARDMAGVKLAANPDQLDEYKTFVSSTPWKDIADITTVAAATIKNVAGDQAVGKAMEKRVVDDYKAIIKHLEENRTLLGQPSGLEPFVLAALKNIGEWQQMVNMFEAGKKTDPLLAGKGKKTDPLLAGKRSDVLLLKAGIAAWRQAKEEAFTSNAPTYAAAIDRRIAELVKAMPKGAREPLPSRQTAAAGCFVFKIRPLDAVSGLPVTAREEWEKVAWRAWVVFKNTLEGEHLFGGGFRPRNPTLPPKVVDYKWIPTEAERQQEPSLILGGEHDVCDSGEIPMSQNPSDPFAGGYVSWSGTSKVSSPGYRPMTVHLVAGQSGFVDVRMVHSSPYSPVSAAEPAINAFVQGLSKAGDRAYVHGGWQSEGRYVGGAGGPPVAVTDALTDLHGSYEIEATAKVTGGEAIDAATMRATFTVDFKLKNRLNGGRREFSTRPVTVILDRTVTSADGRGQTGQFLITSFVERSGLSGVTDVALSSAGFLGVINSNLTGEDVGGAPQARAISPLIGAPGQTVVISVVGERFAPGGQANVGPDVVVKSVSAPSAIENGLRTIKITVVIAANAVPGPRAGRLVLPQGTIDIPFIVLPKEDGGDDAPAREASKRDMSMARDAETRKRTEEEAAAALGAGAGAGAEDLAKIRQLYQNFAEAYSRKNLAQLTRLMAPDWQAADGTSIDEMEQTLRNSFRVFDRVQFKIEGLDIQPIGHNQYQASYTASLVGHMSQRNLKHEESAAVKDIVAITPDGPRISKTAGGKFRMGR